MLRLPWATWNAILLYVAQPGLNTVSRQALLCKPRLSSSPFWKGSNLVSLSGSRDADKMQDHGDKWLCPPRDEQSYMRADTTGHSGTKQQKGPLCFFLSFFFGEHAYLAFDLRAVRGDPLQMAWMRSAAHCLPRYEPLSPCYHPPLHHPHTLTHTSHRANQQGKELAHVQ